MFFEKEVVGVNQVRFGKYAIDKAAVTHNEINESIATTALKYFNELQSHCAKNDSDRFCCNDQNHCKEACKVFDCKVIETRPQVSFICITPTDF